MISAILLAAGQSKRISGKNKLLLKYKRKLLINHILKSLIKSKVQKIIIVLGKDHKEIKKKVLKSKKITFVVNKNYKIGIASSIKVGIKRITKKNKGFIIAQSDMPFIKCSHINKIFHSLSKKDFLVHVLKYKNIIGNPIGFNRKVIRKFKKISGDTGAKYMVKRLKNNTNYLKVNSPKIFRDLDVRKDFN